MEKNTNYPWQNFSDEELLKLRICDLGLDLKHSSLQTYVSQLYTEIEAKGLSHFKPRVYLGDEWFSAEGHLSISIPFYLAHPRLKELEKKLMLEAEGDTQEWCLRLLRHEAGHCFDHVYKFSKSRQWRKIFGSPAQDYKPETFLARPYSRNFVQHLDNFYAQAHPDEDFAETFAVWLDPESNWQERYRRWKGALEKLKFIDQLASSIRHKAPAIPASSMPYQVKNLKKTLAKYYQRKRKENADDFPDFFDQDLERIFLGNSTNTSLTSTKKSQHAATFIRKNRSYIIDVTCRWTVVRKYLVLSLLKRLSTRCQELNLVVARPESEILADTMAFVSAMVSRYFYTGDYRARK